MKRVVISGATGAIGMALIKKCIEENVQVVVLLRPDSARRERIPDHPLVTILDYDLCDYEKITREEIIAKVTEAFAPLESKVEAKADADDAFCEVFYHFAWAGTFGDCRNDKKLQAQNAMYAMSAVSLAKRMGCKAFIGAGSQAEYGRVEGFLTPDTPTNPENGYGIYKLQAGQMTRQLCHDLGMVHVWTRILSVYGPYDGKDTMVSATIRRLISGEVPDFTPAEQVWDYLYSSDAAEAMFLLGCASLGQTTNETEKTAATKQTAMPKNAEILTATGAGFRENTETEVPAVAGKAETAEKAETVPAVDGKIYVIGSGIGRPLREYIKTIRDVVSPKSALGIGKLPYRDKQVMHLVADISDLKRDVGFAPKVDFAEGIRRTAEYIRNENFD